MAYSTINKSTDHFNTVLYTGNGGTQTISGVGFQPDFTWVKGRDHAYYHYLQDAVRGSQKILYTNNSDTEATITAGISAWNADGYVTGSQGALNYNGRTFAAWNWKANGSGSANTDGDINSTVSANTTSGFSIVKWTGSGSVATIGHGLGVAPEFIIIKNLGTSQAWPVDARAVGGTLYLNETGTKQSYANNSPIPADAPTNTVFYVGSANNGNQSGQEMIAYCFASKTGYSKFGSYTGNGNADGTFIYTGFKPALVIAKNTNDTANWWMYDNKRLGYNVLNYGLHPNLTNVEWTDQNIDLLSNGFKMRSNSNTTNGSGDTFIYMAFAAAPLVGSNNVPCTAR